MRVLLAPSDTWGVGSYRVLLPGRELERHGHEVYSYFEEDSWKNWHPTEGNRPLANVFPILGENLAGLRDPRLLPTEIPEGFDADTYVFQRRLEWWMPWVVARLRAFGKHVVSELDDNMDELPVSSPGAKILRDNPRSFSLDQFNESLGFSSVMTVSTESLKEHYSQYNDNVVVLPNQLDWSMWGGVTPQYEVERPRPRIGWMGWLAWRDTDLAILKTFMRDWLLEHPEVEFVSIGEKPGAKTVHDYLAIPREQRRTVPGRRFQELAQIVATIDIGLVSLTHNKFNECKTCLKGMEYAAAGIPCIATPTSPYREWVEPGVNGFLADTPQEWKDALNEMLGGERWRAMGESARVKAMTRTVEKNWGQWEDAWTPKSSQSAPSTACIKATSTSSTPPLISVV